MCLYQLRLYNLFSTLLLLVVYIKTGVFRVRWLPLCGLDGYKFYLSSVVSFTSPSRLVRALCKGMNTLLIQVCLVAGLAGTIYHFKSAITQLEYVLIRYVSFFYHVKALTFH